MSENLTLIKYVDFLFGFSNFYVVTMRDFYLSFQGDFNKALIRCLISYGASYRRVRGILIFDWSGCEFAFSI